MERLQSKTRALISTLLIVLLSAAGLTATTAPASAYSIPPLTDQNRIYTLGDTVDIDFSCQPEFVCEDGGNSSDQIIYNIPPGTSVDANLRLTGTLTEIGSYEIGPFRCYSNGSDTMSNWRNFYPGTIVVNAPLTPTPSLQVTDLNTESCDVLVTAVLPETPQEGSVRLTLNDNSLITFANVAKGELLSIAVSLSNISQSALVHPKVASFSGPGDLCGSEVLYNFQYVYAGAPVGSASQTLTVSANTGSGGGGGGPMATPDLQVNVVEVLDEACTVRVKIRSNLLPEDEKLYLTFKEVDRTTQEDLASVTATVQLISNEPISFDVDLLDFEGSLTDAPVPTLQGDMGGIVHCENVTIAAAAYLGVRNELGESVLSFVGIGSETNAWDQASPMCKAGRYGKLVQDEGKFTRECLPAPVGYYVAEDNVLAEPTPCRVGTYAAEIGSTNCTLAPAGSYVPHFGLGTLTPCLVGTFSPEEGAGECRPAAKDYYVDTVGATSAKKCAASKTTALDGARSANECYLQKTQTAKAIKLPSVLKVGAKLDTPGTADAGLALKVYTSGPCTVKAGTKTVKIKGKSVKQSRWIITAGKTAGLCQVEYTNSGDAIYKPFRVIKKIKVTKTGK